MLDRTKGFYDEDFFVRDLRNGRRIVGQLHMGVMAGGRVLHTPLLLDLSSSTDSFCDTPDCLDCLSVVHAWKLAQEPGSNLKTANQQAAAPNRPATPFSTYC